MATRPRDLFNESTRATCHLLGLHRVLEDIHDRLSEASVIVRQAAIKPVL